MNTIVFLEMIWERITEFSRLFFGLDEDFSDSESEKEDSLHATSEKEDSVHATTPESEDYEIIEKKTIEHYGLRSRMKTK